MPPSPGSVIPDGEVLYRWCRSDAFPKDQVEIPASLFSDIELSCDWARFRPDPSTSFHVLEGKTRVIEISVCDEIKNPRNPKRKGQIVPAWKQQVIYDPIADPVHGPNDAHSLIKGRKKMAVRDAIVANSKWWDIE